MKISIDLIGSILAYTCETEGGPIPKHLLHGEKNQSENLINWDCRYN